MLSLSKHEVARCIRSPDGAQRNPGKIDEAVWRFPDFALLHPGYGSQQTDR
jgi:hypothetical protein